jgi:hypothetical protein
VKTPTTAKENKRINTFLNLHAFHPKALNDCYRIEAGLLAQGLLQRLPVVKNSGKD